MKTHVAIMRKSWKLTEKILAGKKIIESRWYKTKYQPWGKISPGDTVYFKNSGEPVSLRATVSKILSFDNLDQEKVGKILKRYGKDDGIDLPTEFQKYFELFKDKKYCLLIFLKEVERVEPFNIKKGGFGLMASWLIVDDINQIKVTHE